LEKNISIHIYSAFISCRSPEVLTAENFGTSLKKERNAKTNQAIVLDTMHFRF